MTTTETPEPITPEVVADAGEQTSRAPAVVEHQDRANALIEQAAEHALMPGVPGRDEFVTLAMSARILAMSGAAPPEVRNNPYVAFHVAMVGRDLGISPSASLALIDVIKGQNGPQLSLSPQLLNGQVERLGLGHIVPAYRGVDRAVAVAVKPDGHVDARCSRSWPDHVEGCECHGIIGDSEFTWEDARMAGLVAPQCQPGSHQGTCMQKGGSPRCNQGYKTYPKRMLWWRASGFCADDWFPTASLGLYSPEALGAVVDDEGRPVDPSTVELPDGYQPKAPEPVEMVDHDTREALRERIRALPEAARGELMAKWTERDDQGTPYLQPLGKPDEPPKLWKRQLGKARALVTHYEDRARKGEWGDWDPPAAPPAAGEPDGDGGGAGAAAETPQTEEPQSAAGSEGSAGDDGPPPPSPAAAAAPQDTPQARQGVPAEAAGADGRCVVCADSGVAAGAPCWGCTPAEPCSLCGAPNEPRKLNESTGTVHCIDADACWEREKANDPAAAEAERRADEIVAAAKQPEPVDVASREITPADPTDPDHAPDACPLCGSKRSQLVYVPPTHLEETGTWRCQNASACRERKAGKAGLDIARAALPKD